MLVLLKQYIVDGTIPTMQDLEAAKQICIDDCCIVELRWCPNAYAGWYQVLVQPTSDLEEIYNTQLPRVYPV